MMLELYEYVWLYLVNDGDKEQFRHVMTQKTLSCVVLQDLELRCDCGRLTETMYQRLHQIHVANQY